MTRISKRRLTPKLQNHMLYLFWKSLADLRSAREVEFLTHDLFSPVEKIMIAKRFLIALLLLQGQSFRKICDLLKVSPNTVSSVAKKTRRPGLGYGRTLKILLTRPEIKKFTQNLL